jgi:peptidoglycan/LPS O-acetylase OafA/YrhL
MLAMVAGLAVIAASLSYFFVEKPFLRFKDRRRRAKPGREVP